MPKLVTGLFGLACVYMCVLCDKHKCHEACVYTYAHPHPILWNDAVVVVIVVAVIFVVVVVVAVIVRLGLGQRGLGRLGQLGPQGQRGQGQR